MLESVAGEVRDQLSQPILIPFPTAGPAQFELRLRVVLPFAAQLIQDHAANIGQIELLAAERNASAEPHAREIEDLIDHAAHPIGAAQDATDRLGDALRVRAA